MLRDFHAFQIAKQVYLHCKSLKLPAFMKDQLLRASSSVGLNLAEGSGKRTEKDQRRFYFIALGSLRECEAIIELESISDKELTQLVDRLGAIIFTLCKQKSNKTAKLYRTETVTETETSNGA